MADRQSQHRQELETLVVAGKDRRATHGLYIGGFLALLVAVFGFVLVLSGRSVAGFGTLVAEAGTLAGVFIVGRTQQRKERLEKARLAPLPPTPSQQPQLPFRPIEDARGP